MKLFTVTVVLLHSIILFPFHSLADTRFPVYFFQIENQEHYIYPSELESMNWREIRDRKKTYRAAREEIKKFSVKTLESETLQFPELQFKKTHEIFTLSEDDFLTGSDIFIRDTNGRIYPGNADITDTGTHISIPEDINLAGRYLLGAHLSSKEQDIVMDNTPEEVHISLKYLVPHYKNGGNVGSTSVVFFDDPDLMPLEIGPVINTAKSRYGGGTQTVHREYKMMVKFNAKPLASAKVTVMSIESGWSKSFVTDSRGIIEIMPTDDRSGSKDFQNYLYIATHHDTDKDQYYITTFPVTINKNRPEWRSKTTGFIFWSITGTAMILLTIAGYWIRKRQRQNRKLAVYEKQTIN